MFIRVEKDILELAVKDGEQSIAIDCLTEISLAVKRGKHYVYIPDWLQFSDSLSKLMPGPSYSILNSLRRNDAAALDKALKRKLIVTEDTATSFDKEALIFHPSKNPAFEIFEETHLLCENITESNFYAKVEAYYRRNIVPNLSRGSRFLIFPRNGGGASAEKVVESERTLRNHLLFIIADSDYKYCFSQKVDGKDVIDRGNIGDTATKLRNILNADPYSFAYLYVLENLREVENMIPKDFLRNLQPNSDQKSIDLIDNHDIEYLDVKEGLRIIHFFDSKVLDYWEGYLQSIGSDLSLIEAAVNTHKSKNKYRDYIKDNPTEALKNRIIDGWGNNILEKALKFETKIDNFKLNLDTVNPSHLTHAQQKEWKSVGEHLFAWGIAANPSYR